MGYYIQGPTLGKANHLIHNENAIELPSPQAARQAFDAGQGVVCVVENGIFDAAGFAFSKEELDVFTAPDTRLKRWLSMDLQRCLELTGCDKYKGPGQ